MPSEAARDLLDDPERLSLSCMQLLRYSEAKHAFDHADKKKELDVWKGNSMMERVQKYEFAKAEARFKAKQGKG